MSEAYRGLTTEEREKIFDTMEAEATKAITGVYQKYVVTRTDGSSELGGKHHGCDYFVLDLTHDDFALPALIAYEKACRSKFPALADDLKRKIEIMQALKSPYFTGNYGDR